MTEPEIESLKRQAVETLKTCYDPEIPVDIYELGLIYDLQVDTSGLISIKMTLTAPNCPVADLLPREVERKLRTIPGVTDVKLELVWDPPWDREKMSDAAKLALGFDLGPPAERLTRLPS